MIWNQYLEKNLQATIISKSKSNVYRIDSYYHWLQYGLWYKAQAMVLWWVSCYALICILLSSSIIVMHCRFVNIYQDTTEREIKNDKKRNYYCAVWPRHCYRGCNVSVTAGTWLNNHTFTTSLFYPF